MLAEKNTVEITYIEKEIIKLIAKEVSNKDIAKELNYSQRNIEYYISDLLKKFEVQTRVGIVVKSIVLGIITL
ncbi:response regulator transcription factor [Priestia aryabhattai]|uniref:response regulator transcription factor n=1 Tax=Priestia TaxID=2800373 RepID=UPI001455BCAF|nr:LuxR C-terminal-related transcriptional regulator [Priestia aryabhattai]MBY0008137.1 response regulator transcription factor [Priestia aryabhattai]MBY0049940.1 response regulator transcription factor [Priestia aryabhattai]NLR46955.1 response regulator transcription factor [Priestia megaterium]